MVVCKYFLQGKCRYGENCRHEHQRSGGSMHSPEEPMSLNVLLQSVFNDMQNAEKGGMWILSQYAPFKDKVHFPGFEDQSFEEIRFRCYDAKQKGVEEQFKQEFLQVMQDAKNKMKALQNPNSEAKQLLMDIYNTPVSTGKVYAVTPTLFQSEMSGFGSGSVFGQTNTNANTVFGGQPSVFGGGNTTNSIFGGSSANQTGFGQKSAVGFTAQPSLFGSPNAFSGQANSTFGSPSQSIFGGSTQQQQQQPTNGQSIFGQSASVFSNQAAQISPFQSQSTFAQSTQNSSSIFGGQAQNTTPFGQPASSSSSVFSGTSFNTFRDPSNTSSSSVFGGQPGNNAASSIFANAVANLQNTNTFAGGTTAQSAGSSPFAPAPLFAATPATNNTNSVFASSAQIQVQPSQTNVFATAQPATPFGTSIFTSQAQQNPTAVYATASNTSTPFGALQGSIFSNNASVPTSSTSVSSVLSSPNQSIFGSTTGATIQEEPQQGFNPPPTQPQTIFGAQNPVFASQSQSIFSSNSSVPASSTISVSSVFSSPSTTQSIFGTSAATIKEAQPQQGFNQPSQPQSIFSTQNSPSQSIFASNTAQTVTQTPATFSSVTSAPSKTSIFGSTAQPVTQTPSIFSNVTSVTSPSQSSIFGGSGGSIFGTSSSQSSGIFGSGRTKVENLSSMFNEMFYSSLEDTTEEELEFFKADHFEFGCIPDKPPPLQLCL